MWDRIIQKAGQAGERWAREKFWRRGYRIYRQGQRRGVAGFDYYLEKINPPYPRDMPDRIHIGTVINTSGLTSHQREIMLDITVKGRDYLIDGLSLPLSLEELPGRW